MFNAANILEALKNYIHARGGTSNAYNIAEAVNDLNSIPQGSGGDIPPGETEPFPIGCATPAVDAPIGFCMYGLDAQTLTPKYMITCDQSFTEWIVNLV